jgi:uncharacterized membrane protein
MKNANTKRIVGLALFTAIVVVLQLLGSFIKLGPFSISLVLVPIVVGAALYGATGGAWLGLVFSIVVLVSGDAAAFMIVSVPGTLATVLVKGTLAGLVAGLVYKALEKASITVAVIVSAIVCPIVNTGVFVAGCYAFFLPTIAEWAGSGTNVGVYIITVMIGVNFLAELVINVVLAPVILRLIRIGKKA